MNTAGATWGGRASLVTDPRLVRFRARPFGNNLGVPYVRCPSCMTQAYVAAGVGHVAACPHCGEVIEGIPSALTDVSGHGEAAAARRAELTKVDDAAPQSSSAGPVG